MISLAVAWVYVTAIQTGMDGMQPLIFVMTGMLDVAMIWGAAIAVRGWPPERALTMKHQMDE